MNGIISYQFSSATFPSQAQLFTQSVAVASSMILPLSKSGLEVIKLFPCTPQLSLNFFMLTNPNLLSIAIFFLAKHSWAWYFLYCWHFHIHLQRTFHVQLSWAWKKFYNLEACLCIPGFVSGLKTILSAFRDRIRPQIILLLDVSRRHFCCNTVPLRLSIPLVCQFLNIVSYNLIHLCLAPPKGTW